MKKTLLSTALALSLCAWLGADTKEGGGTTDPTDPPVTSTAKQMLTVDGAKTTLYPASSKYSLKAAALIEAVEDLNAKSATLSELDALLETYDIELTTLESEVAP